jgi:hypothetical protein
LPVMATRSLTGARGRILLHRCGVRPRHDQTA